MRVFVPLEDAGLDPEVGPLVPYHPGLVCLRGLREREAAANAAPPLSDGSAARRPAPGPAAAPGRR
jgi:hypothetical protein